MDTNKLTKAIFYALFIIMLLLSIGMNIFFFALIEHYKVVCDEQQKTILEQSDIINQHNLLSLQVISKNEWQVLS